MYGRRSYNLISGAENNEVTCQFGRSKNGVGKLQKHLTIMAPIAHVNLKVPDKIYKVRSAFHFLFAFRRRNFPDIERQRDEHTCWTPIRKYKNKA